MALVVVLLAAIVVSLSVELLRLRSQLYDRHWTEAKIIPLMRDIAKLDPEDREYLDVESLCAWTRGEITIDQVMMLKKEPSPQP